MPGGPLVRDARVYMLSGVDEDAQGDAGGGGAKIDVVGPPPGELFSETNDNSVAILLTYGTARILLAGDAEAREEQYMAGGPYTGPLTLINVPKLHTL
jgi:beta-lactamase superfamily II metal-dependent hydrolase